jgi:hypothetical protein
LGHDEILVLGETPVYLGDPHDHEALVDATRRCENGGRVVIRSPTARKAVRKAPVV